MAGLRFNLDLFIPEDPDGVYVDALGVKLPSVVVNHLQALKDEIRLAKSYARKINEGEPDEEMTVKADYHICRHEDGLPCDPKQEI